MPIRKPVEDWVQALDQSHSLLIQSAPAADKVITSIIHDEKVKAYSKIEAVKALFSIIQTGVIDRQNMVELTALKEQLNALEGNSKIIEVN